MAAKEKTPKSTVISFRITPKQERMLADAHKADKPLGVGTIRQMARKIVLDRLNGRLDYKDQTDRNRDLERYPEA